MRKEIDRFVVSRKRYNQENPSGGNLVRFIRERNRAVMRELLNRDQNNNSGILLHVNTSASAQNPSTSSRRFPLQYLEDNRRIQRDLDMSSAGISKPSRGDRLIAART